MMVAYNAGAFATTQAHNISTAAQRVRRSWDVESWPTTARRTHVAATTQKPRVKRRQRHNFLPGCGVSGALDGEGRKEVERREAGRYFNHGRWILKRTGSGRRMRMICVKMSSAPYGCRIQQFIDHALGPIISRLPSTKSIVRARTQGAVVCHQALVSYGMRGQETNTRRTGRPYYRPI
jgi:hypothetical protein